MELDIDLVHKVFYPIHQHVGESGEIMYKEADLHKAFSKLAEQLKEAAVELNMKELMNGGTDTKFLIGSNVICQLSADFFGHNYTEADIKNT